MSKKKFIRLISSSGSKHFYTILKKKDSKKLTLKKYDPLLKKHYLYKEK